MDVKDAVKQVKEESARKKKVDGKALLIKKGHKLLKLIYEENKKPEFHHKIYLIDAFMERGDDDLDYSSTLDEVVGVKNGRVYFSAYCHWAYGGYAEAQIIIPIKNLELSSDEIRKKCLDYAVKYFNYKIKEENEDWKVAIKHHEDDIAKIKSNLATVQALKKNEMEGK